MRLFFTACLFIVFTFSGVLHAQQSSETLNDRMKLLQLNSNLKKELENQPVLGDNPTKEALERYYRARSEITSRYSKFLAEQNYDKCSPEFKKYITEHKYIYQQYSDACYDFARCLSTGSSNTAMSVRKLMKVESDLFLNEHFLICIATGKKANTKEQKAVHLKMVKYINESKPSPPAGGNRFEAVKQIPDYTFKMYFYLHKISASQTLNECSMEFLLATKEYCESISNIISTLEDMPPLPSSDSEMLLIALGALFDPNAAKDYTNDLDNYNQKFSACATREKEAFKKLKAIAER